MKKKKLPKKVALDDYFLCKRLFVVKKIQPILNEASVLEEME